MKAFDLAPTGNSQGDLNASNATNPRDPVETFSGSVRLDLTGWHLHNSVSFLTLPDKRLDPILRFGGWNFLAPTSSTELGPGGL